MSETPPPRRVLHLVIEDFPAGKLAEVSVTAQGANEVTEIVELKEENAREALEKIFAADTVMVWGKTE